jgi:riboflavin kinase/FMN adenylyltransferase
MRRALLLQAGADAVERLVPTPKLLGQSAREFIERLFRTHRPSAIVEGPNFRFGASREGDILILEELGREMGFGVHILEPIQVALMDQTLVTASSTMVRWLVSMGRVRDATLLLGRPYEMEGSVQRGDRRGRQIGFPTANLSTDYLVPADGIYACRAILPDGRECPAGVHVGPRDTFADDRRVIEAHLIGVERDADRLKGLTEYGWNLRLQFIAWLRDPVRFESIDKLVEQMDSDCRRAARLVARAAPDPPIAAPSAAPQEVPA